MQLQLIVVQRAPQTALEIEPISESRTHGRGIHDDGPGCACLGLIHGGIGVLEHGRDIRTVIGVYGDADAGRRVELEAVVGNRLVEHRGTRGRDLERNGSRLRLADQHDEFIAAEAGDGHRVVRGLKGSENPRELAGDILQHGVADRMPEGVIDTLEAVEIQIDDRDLPAGPGRIGEQALRRVDAALSIRQLGQGVEIGEPLDALGGRRIAQDVGEAPGQEGPVDGLRNEVGGARLEGAADRDRVFVARHHDDRHRGKACIGAQPSAHGVSVHPRHIDVQQHDGHFPRQGRLERRGSVIETQRGESRSHRRFGKQQPAEILIVGDDGDRLGRSLAHALSRS